MKPLFYTIFFAILAGSVQRADILAALVVVAGTATLVATAKLIIP